MEENNQNELSVTFNCHECGAPAGTVTLSLIPDVRSFRISGFFNEISGGMPKEHYNPFLDALKNKNATNLYLMSTDYAPFYCSSCYKCYCLNHWHYQVQFDIDEPIYYDSTTGTCPKGHRKMIDD